MWWQWELMDKSGKIHKVNVQDVKVTYPVNELIKYLHDETAFRCTTKYRAHPKLVEDICYFLELNILPDLKDNLVGSPHVHNKCNQSHPTQNTPVTDTTMKDSTKYVGSDHSIKLALFTILQQTLPIFAIYIVNNLWPI